MKPLYILAFWAFKNLPKAICHIEADSVHHEDSGYPKHAGSAEGKQVIAKKHFRLHTAKKGISEINKQHAQHAP